MPITNESAGETGVSQKEIKSSQGWPGGAQTSTKVVPNTRTILSSPRIGHRGCSSSISNQGRNSDWKNKRVWILWWINQNDRQKMQALRRNTGRNPPSCRGSTTSCKSNWKRLYERFKRSTRSTTTSIPVARPSPVNPANTGMVGPRLDPPLSI